ncbi:hypothetical protein DZD18_00810, partial [Rhodobacteraceae bacterium W635]|uniref:tautomerase family protein n=1 Tax=Nioella halotolerans TaxID=2303578 RepID=UPI000E905CF6
MPLVDIQLIEGVFDTDQKRRMIEEVTETMVGIEGEPPRVSERLSCSRPTRLLQG